MKYKTFHDLIFQPHPIMGTGGTRAFLSSPNGYGVSVITGEYAYTDENNQYEVAVIKDGACCYTTPITDDVIGYLNEEGVTEIMRQIQSL